MKKIIVITLICLFSKVSFAQNNSYEGNANTITNFASSGAPTAFGLAKANFVNASIFADTTAANTANFLKNYNGTQLITYTGGAKFWIRYGGAWVQMSGGSSGWGLTGNAGTIAGTNFIGTTDSVRFDIRTNNTIRQSVTGSGNVGIGTVTPISKFHVNGTIRGTDSLVLTGLLRSASSGDSVLVKTSTGVVKSIAQSAISGVNIYNTNGTLTGDRIVSGGATNGITFTDNSFVNIDATDAVDIASQTELHLSGKDSIVIESNLQPSTTLIIPRLTQGIPSGAKRLLIGSNGTVYAADTTAGGGGGQNISNASLTADGDYTQNWNGKQLWFDSLASVRFQTNNGISFNSSISGNDFAYFYPDGTFYTQGQLGAVNDKTFEISNEGLATIKSLNTSQDKYETRFNIEVNNDTVNAYFNNVRLGINNTSPTEALDVTGNIIASGTITPSDARYKKNIKSINNPLSLLMRMKPSTYNYNTDAFPLKKFNEGKQYGLIAQDLEQVVPELVKTYKDGYKGVNYTELIPILIGAIQDQQKQIEELKRLIKK